MLEFNFILNVIVGIFIYKAIVGLLVFVLRTTVKHSIARQMVNIANDTSIDMSARSEALDKLFELYKKAN